MVAVPAATPVTTPAATVAMPLALVVHVPPDTLSDKVVVEPAQTEAVPVIAAGVKGIAFTVTTWVTVALPHDAEVVV